MEILAMDVFLYFFERLSIGLDEVEDILDEVLSGIGEVTGSGIGERGSNLDIFIKDEIMSREQVIDLIRTALKHIPLPKSSRIVIGNDSYIIQ
jgi:hypothetical protein